MTKTASGSLVRGVTVQSGAPGLPGHPVKVHSLQFPVANPPPPPRGVAYAHAAVCWAWTASAFHPFCVVALETTAASIEHHNGCRPQPSPFCPLHSSRFDLTHLCLPPQGASGRDGSPFESSADLDIARQLSARSLSGQLEMARTHSGPLPIVTSGGRAS